MGKTRLAHLERDVSSLSVTYFSRKKFAEYHSYKAAFGDVSYAYAMTCYKAQGSTYKHIFVDMNDIRTTGPLSKKRKLQSWYTAVTRASHNVYLIGQDA